MWVFMGMFITVACSDDETPKELKVLVANVSFDANGGQGTIQVNTNASLTVTSDREWCVTTCEGNVVKVEVDTNEELEGRTAGITISTLQGTTVVPVSQEGCTISYKRSEAGIILPYTGGNRTVSLKTNKNYEVLIPESAQGWLSYSIDNLNGTLTFTATPSLDMKPRGADVEVKIGNSKVIYHVGSYEEKDMEGMWVCTFNNGEGNPNRRLLKFYGGEYWTTGISNKEIPMPFTWNNDAFRVQIGRKVATLGDDNNNLYYCYTAVLTENGFVNWDSQYSYVGYPSYDESSGRFRLVFGSDTDLGSDAVNGIAFWLFNQDNPNSSTNEGYIEMFYDFEFIKFS